MLSRGRSLSLSRTEASALDASEQSNFLPQTSGALRQLDAEVPADVISATFAIGRFYTHSHTIRSWRATWAEKDSPRNKAAQHLMTLFFFKLDLDSIHLCGLSCNWPSYNMIKYTLMGRPRRLQKLLCLDNFDIKFPLWHCTSRALQVLHQAGVQPSRSYHGGTSSARCRLESRRSESVHDAQAREQQCSPQS